MYLQSEACLLGQERTALFAYTLLSIIVSFASSITSNCLRRLETLFGVPVKPKRFYTFMASSTLTWIYADRLKANPERRHKVKGRAASQVA